MSHKKYAFGLVTMVLALTALPASAHTLAGTAGGFGSGLAHPFLGIDHLLAMLAVGLWAVQLGGSAVWKVPLAFVVTMLLGAGLAGVDLPFIETVIAASVLVLGLAITLQWRLAPLLASLMVALFALFHGHAHGSAMPVTASPLIYFAGFAATTLVLHALGAASGYLLFQRSQAVLVRAGGMALAGAGLWLLIGV
ncbi:MAG: HupE/UreJ family protein [Sulfuricaulis sp.]|nr:HupE/UreJ family protein [Sulfuricaulis sp.]